MKTSSARVYEFAGFRIDAAKRLLLQRDGSPVPLTPRVFETLLYLVEHGGEVLDRDRVMEAVWPDAVVEENNLTQNISILRRVLGEERGANQFIVTVPGRGYRFVAEVRHTEEAEESPPSLEPARPRADASSEMVVTPAARGRAVSIASAIATLVLAVAAFFWWRKPMAVRPGAVSIPQKSIAVLPFENLSDDKENSYFVAGVQDEILSDLARVAELKVTSRTSANLYKSGNPRNLREIGHQLGVAHVLEGSVQRAGNHLRVHAQLVDARSDTHLWAQTYDRDLADVFAIQSEIATAIVQQLRARLAPEEKARLEAKPTNNTDAYLLYLQAYELARVARKKTEAVGADQLYDQALALDPQFALAAARASILNSYMFQVGRMPERKEKARKLADQSLGLAPDLSEAHLALGLCYYRNDQDYHAALKELAIASAASPNDSEILDFSAYIYRRQGRWREALALFARAQELDPRIAHYAAAPNTLRLLRQWTLAAEAYQHSLQLDPNLPDGWIGLAYVQFAQSGSASSASETLRRLPDAQNNKPDAVAARLDYALMARDFALAERIAADAPNDEFVVLGPKPFLRACVELARGNAAEAHPLLEEVLPLYETAARDHPDEPKFLATLAKVYALLGRKGEAIQTARRAVELCPESKDASAGPEYATNLAFVYAQSGEVDQAVRLVSRLLTTPAAERVTLAHLRLSWEWNPLRHDPRFQKILADPEPMTSY